MLDKIVCQIDTLQEKAAEIRFLMIEADGEQYYKLEEELIEIENKIDELEYKKESYQLTTYSMRD